MRAADVVRARSVWVLPLIVGSLLVMFMTLIYFGSLVDPSGHLHGLPVSIVNEDRGITTSSGPLNVGDMVVAGLKGAPAVSSRLSLQVRTLAEAEAQMDEGTVYATVVIPAGFSASVAALAGAPVGPGQTPGLPTIQLLTNPRAGTLGVSLATGVVQPAIASVSHSLGEQLLKSIPAGETANPSLQALRADPITLSTAMYRPLPAHSALGLSAF